MFMVCWSESMKVGKATREATLGTRGSSAETVVLIFSKRVLRSSTDFWRASMASGEPEQADTRLLCSWMDGAWLELGIWRR